MESKSDHGKTLVKKIQEFIWKSIPFITVLLVIGLVILPLGKKISAKKADLAEKRSREKTI